MLTLLIFGKLAATLELIQHHSQCIMIAAMKTETKLAAKPQLKAAIIAEAKFLFERGLTVRQIAHKLDQLPSAIKSQAQQHNWVAGTVTDWGKLRQRYEEGEDITQIAKTCTVALSTLHKRKRRENWSRERTSGLDALRRAVAALENALQNAPDDDTVLTMRISTALSMAAARLSRAEKGLGPIENELDPQDDADDEQAITELSRLLSEWQVDEEK